MEIADHCNVAHRPPSYERHPQPNGFQQPLVDKAFGAAREGPAYAEEEQHCVIHAIMNEEAVVGSSRSGDLHRGMNGNGNAGDGESRSGSNSPPDGPIGLLVNSCDNCYHGADEPQVSGNQRSSSVNPEPDTTTANLVADSAEEDRSSGRFVIAQHVFVKDEDGRLVFGTIIAVNSNQCLVRFDDSTERWALAEELIKLSAPSESASGRACVNCKQPQPNGAEEDGQPLEVCHNCNRAYHGQCLSRADGNGWYCDWCNVKNDVLPLAEWNTAPFASDFQLPYDMEELTWDAAHHVNEQEMYCYCGEDGEWTKEMIQCCRCEQWFHERCIRSLQYPLFLGDRFYFFLCTVCNHGHEFVRRLEMGWPELVHLVLYNLMVRNGKRFYSLTNSIMPYVEENWRALQLPEHMAKHSSASRKEMINRALTADRMRFRPGTESKKSRTAWMLRVLQPPNPPVLLVPQGQIITEHILNQMALDDGSYRFLPRVAFERTFVYDPLTREPMTGINCCSPLVEVNPTIEDDDLEAIGFGAEPESFAMVSVDSTGEQNGSSSHHSLGSELSSNASSKSPQTDQYRSFLDALIPPTPDFLDANNPYYDPVTDGKLKHRAKEMLRHGRKYIPPDPDQKQQQKRVRNGNAIISVTTSEEDLEEQSATARLIKGEKHIIHGRRVTVTGEIQYLIEWVDL